MATLSSHTLNSVDGTHAGGINVSLVRIEPNGSRTQILTTAMDDGGRLSEVIEIEPAHADALYELVFQTGDYFSARSPQRSAVQILQDVVIRFTMPDPEGRYHIPLMLAPNSYSVWWSS